MALFAKKTDEQVAVKKAHSVGTVIGEGIEFVGDFQTEEVFDIRGSVQGSIKSPAEVIVSKNGVHHGTMDVEYLTVDGTVDSEIYCKNTTTLNSDCQVTGTLHTVNLDAHNGSNFTGKLFLKNKAAE